MKATLGNIHQLRS